MKEKRNNEPQVQEETHVAVVEEHRPRLDERFLANIQGKDFVLYTGLLDLAHQHGLERLEVEYIQFPSQDNGETAICKATAVARNGAVFTDIGDANPTNVNKKIAPHIIRMASTRAKARVLRDLTNIGITCLEELGDLSDALEDNYGPKSSVPYKSYNRSYSNREEESFSSPRREVPVNRNAPASARQPERQPERQADWNNKPKAAPALNGGAPRISDAQKRALFNLATRHGMSPEELQSLAEERFGSVLEDLSSADAASLIRYLQQAS